MKEPFTVLFDLLAQIWKSLNTDVIYVIDSIPIAVCDNIRIRRAKIYADEKFRGYQASKKRYFYGLKIHLMVTQDGQPVECCLTHGGFGDVDALKYYAYELPDGSMIYADKAYNDYEIEDLLKEVEPIDLIPMRKKNSKRALSPSISFVSYCSSPICSVSFSPYGRISISIRLIRHTIHRKQGSIPLRGVCSAPSWSFSLPQSGSR